jgi:hypothetical protein
MISYHGICVLFFETWKETSSQKNDKRCTETPRQISKMTNFIKKNSNEATTRKVGNHYKVAYIIVNNLEIGTNKRK